MSDSRYNQSNSAGGSTGTVRMGCTLVLRDEYDKTVVCSGNEALSNYFDHLFSYLLASYTFTSCTCVVCSMLMMWLFVCVCLCVC